MTCAFWTFRLTVTGVSGSSFRFAISRAHLAHRDVSDRREAAELLVASLLGQVGGPDLDGVAGRVADEHARRCGRGSARAAPEPDGAQLVVLRACRYCGPESICSAQRRRKSTAKTASRIIPRTAEPERDLRRQPVGLGDARVRRQEAPGRRARSPVPALAKEPHLGRRSSRSGRRGSGRRARNREREQQVADQRGEQRVDERDAARTRCRRAASAGRSAATA